MWYRERLDRALCLASVICGVSLMGTYAHGATLDVCATCTHTTLDSAFAAADPGDTILLDGPTVLTDPPRAYTLTTNLTIDDTKDDIEIRGKFASRPDLIEIVGTGTGPVITVEEGNSFKLRNVTIRGGTTGLLAMKDSDVEIRRSLFDGIAGIGINCIEPTNVYVAGTIITGSNSDAIRIDQGGKVEVLQCTLLTNTGLGVNAIDGMAHIVATLIHDSAGGIDGTATTLEVRGNWVTDSGGAPQAMPTGVTDPDAVTDTLVYATVFETVVDPFPGKLVDGTQERLSGVTSADLSQDPFDMPFTGLDFDGEARNGGDLVVGADEVNPLATAALWTECVVTQNGFPRAYVGEGLITIAIGATNIDLSDASLYIKHEDVTDITAVGARYIGPLNITTESTLDTSFGYVDYTVDEAVFTAAFPPPLNIQQDYIIYLHSDRSQPITDVTELHGSPEGYTEDGQAVYGRIFGLDTVPPTIVTNLTLLADQYLTAISAADGDAIEAPGWGALPLLGTVGANAGYMNGNTGEPSVFFSSAAVSPPYPPTGPYTLANAGLSLTFRDVGSGFATEGLPSARTATTTGDKQRALFIDYRGRPGFAWWDDNGESSVELISSAAGLSVTYTNVAGNELQTSWNFSNLFHDGVTQWHAIANVRVMDLAGNEATLDPNGVNFIPLRPFHFWWFPYAKGEFRSGPSRVPSTAPVFTWNMFRFGRGEDPKDTSPGFSTVRWRLWGATSPGSIGTSWVDLTGGAWSQWMIPTERAITLNTYFAGATRLRDLMTGGPGAEYLIALQGYDEAGNLQAVPPLGNLVSANELVLSDIDFRRWTDPGVSIAASLDTKVQATYWHNNPTIAGTRAIDGGEKTFGSAPRVPLPVCPARVEAGFNITMEIPDTVAYSAARVRFELFEDGRFVVGGLINPSAAPAGYTLSLPQDLLVPGTWLTITAGDLSFLNVSECFPGAPDRLGDDGPLNSEPPYRQRDVKYQLLLQAGIPTGNPPPNDVIFDPTPATVEFTVTVDRGLKDDQPVKRFVQE